MMRKGLAAGVAAMFTGLIAGVASADEFAGWVPLKSTFPSTGGGGIMIKGYDPVIVGDKCLTTFMAVEPGDKPNVYPNFIEFEAQAVAGGTLCTNGKWRAFDGGATGTTPFRIYFRDGTFLMPPG